MFFVKRMIVLLTVVLLMVVLPVIAKEAVPMSSDPELEKKVNEIAAELRCLVCQNQTIADSHAELAVDLKNQVREMVGAVVSNPTAKNTTWRSGFSRAMRTASSGE